MIPAKPLKPSTSLLLALFACHAPAPSLRAPAPSTPDVAYTLELVEAPTPRLRITVELAAAPDGTTVFDLDPWGLVGPPEAIFQAVTATADNRPVAVDHQAHAWVVHSAPRARVVLRYEIPNDEGTDRVVRRHHPVVRPHLVHLFGNNALVSPHHLDDHRPKRIALHWAAFAEVGWTTLSSHGATAHAVVDLPLEQFRDAEFLASDRVQVVRRRAGGAELITALVAASWPFGIDELADVTAKLMDTEAALIGESFPPVFLSDLVPFNADGYRGGTALHDAFVAQADTKQTLVEHGDRRGSLAWMFAHELLHSWIGRTIVPTVDDGEKWFIEGFTTFYARRVMVRAGLATVEDYAAQLDETLAEYAWSPIHGGPEVAFAVADDAQRGMAYTRGDLIAVVVDAEIRRASAGKRSLDDVMRALVADGRAGGKIDAAKLIARFERETSPAFAAKLRGVIERGDTVELEPASFEPCLHGEVRKLDPFDLGFDFEKSEAAHRVVGLHAGSSAAAAGLREGEELAGWSFASQRVDQTVVLQVGTGLTKREVRFVPVGAPVPILQFRVGERAACAARL